MSKKYESLIKIIIRSNTKYVEIIIYNIIILLYFLYFIVIIILLLFKILWKNNTFLNLMKIYSLLRFKFTIIHFIH